MPDDSSSPNPRPVGRTLWDIIAEVLSRKKILFPILGALVLLFTFLISYGLLEISLNEGIKFSFGKKSDQNNELPISGNWIGSCEDLQSSHDLYKYTINLTLKQKGTTVELSGTYSINERPNENIPIRQITGSGVQHGEYVNFLYDVRTQETPSGIGYGAILLRFHPSGRRCEGNYLTRSMKDDGMIFGKVELSR